MLPDAQIQAARHHMAHLETLLPLQPLTVSLTLADAPG
jgi:hypothetical protein